jgi:hypothetical protein
MSASQYSQRYSASDTQTAGAFQFDTINGIDYAVSKVAFGAMGSVTYVDASNPLPVTISGVATAANQATANTSLASIDGKLTACNTGAVVLAAGSAAIGKLAANDGVDIGDATINNGSGASAVNIQDGGNSVTVDAPVATPVFVRLSDGAAAITALPVTDNGGNLSIDDGGNSITVDGTVAVSGTVTIAGAVTNAGTFAVQDSQVVADNAGFTDGTTKLFMAGYIFDETAGTSLTENDAAAPRIDSKRASVCTIEDETTRGRRATVTAGNALKVDASSVAVPITDNSGSLTVDYATTGSGTATGALRVELANNGTGVLATLGTITNVVHVDDNSSTLSIDDGAGSITVDGTVSATLSSSTNAGATAKTADYDSGAGTDTVTMFGIALPASGGAVAGGTSTNPIQVSLANTAANSTAVKVDGSAVTQPVSIAATVTISGTVTANAGTNLNTSALALESGGNLASIASAVFAEDAASANADKGIQVLAVLKATPADTAGTDGDYQPLQMKNGRVWASATIDAALPAGTNAIGKLAANTGVTIGAVEIASSQTLATVTTVGTVTTITNVVHVDDNSASITVDLPAVATGGATPFRILSAGSTNATSVKGSAGTLYSLVAVNTNAAVRYLKLYNKATSPTVGSDTPVFTFAIPGNTAGAGFALPIPTCGIAFSTGIAAALTTGAGDSDTGAVAANEITVNGAYK